MIKGLDSLDAVEVLVTYRHRSGPQEVQVRVLPEQVSFWMGGIKLLPTHDEMAGEVTPCKTNPSNIKGLSVYYCYTINKGLSPDKTQQIVGGERL